MATEVTESLERIFVEETDFKSPVSEATFQKFGAVANYLTARYPVPPGQISMFAGPEANVPTGYIPCDGRRLVKVDYALLYAAIGDYWGTPGLTDFQVPDFRGLFPRMQSQTDVGDSGRDPDQAARAPLGSGLPQEVGSYQADAFQQHSHGIPAQSGGASGASPSWAGQPSINFDNQTTPRGNSVETRPKNAFVMMMIKT